MSYENPRAVIDTQSAQGLQQLQNTIAGTFAGVAKSYKEDQKEKRDKLNANAKRIDGIRAKNQEYEDNIRNRMNEFGAENPSLNTEAWLDAIDRINEIKNTIDLGNEKPEVVARLRQELSAISALPTLGRTLLTDMSEGVIGLKELIENTGKEGGLDRYGNPNIVEDLKTWENTTKGSRKQVAEKDGNGGWRVYLDINGRRYTREQLANVQSNDSGIVSVVPNQSDNFAVYSNLVREIDPKTKKPIFKPEVLGEIKTETRIDEKGNKFLVEVQEVNKDVAKNLAKSQIQAGIAGMSQSEKAVYWNNILAKKTANNKLDGDVMTAESFEDPKMLEKFTEEYTNKWFKANIGEEVIISSKKVDKPNEPKITPEIKRNIEAIGESLKTEPIKVFKGRKFGTSGLKVEDVEIKDGKIKVILDDGTVTTKDKGVSTTKMKVKEIDYDLSNPADIRNLARTLYKENSEEYNVLLNYLFLDAKSRTTNEPSDEPLPEAWTP